MSQLSIVSLLGLLALISGMCNTSEGSRHLRRVRRHAYAIPEKPLVRNTDRSVYARRNFALPDVVSDVYEVYVGPSEVQDNPTREAVTVINGNPNVEGVVLFKQMHPNEPVHVNGTIRGLTPGQHGFHVHQKGDLTNGCTSAGGHLNPYMQHHGAPTDRNRHVGDLGNINANEEGIANFMFMDHLISLSGVNSVVGRAVVVHEKQDDLGRGISPDSKKTGNAGGRVGCGVIGLSS